MSAGLADDVEHDIQGSIKTLMQTVIHMFMIGLLSLNVIAWIYFKRTLTQSNCQTFVLELDLIQIQLSLSNFDLFYKSLFLAYFSIHVK